jgi:hypothetical protein
MKIDTLWIVTRAGKHSVLQDIVFSCTIEELQRQFIGGLDASDIIGVWTDEKEARAMAKTVLACRDFTYAKLEKLGV